MTSKEAIERLEFLKGVYSVDMETALGMAIEALSQPIVAKHFDIQSGHIYCSPEIAENVRVVVQCKDCVWSKEWNDNQIFCDRILMRLRETDFCSYGERREP